MLPDMSTRSDEQLGDDVVGAFWRARQEAESWARVYEQIRWTVVIEARAAGMSYGAIADRLELSKPMVTRILLASAGNSPQHRDAWGVAERRRFDDTWIEAGAPRVASPEGQYRHGLIDEYECRRLDAQLDLAHKPIHQQLHDAVHAHPGLTAPQLLPYMAVAVASVEKATFTHHADAAAVAVDGAGRYWPTVTVDELRPGDRVPRHPAAFAEGGEWVTIDRINRSETGDIQEIAFTLDDGLRSAWYRVQDGERYPIDRPS